VVLVLYPRVLYWLIYKAALHDYRQRVVVSHSYGVIYLLSKDIHNSSNDTIIISITNSNIDFEKSFLVVVVGF
jgi:uncharacterized membrane protein